jgi:hypothetical protein
VSRGTPSAWQKPDAWKHGAPRRIVVSGERPDMAQLPETAGEQPPSARRSLSPLALVIGASLVLGGLYVLADWLVKVR